MAKKSKKKFVTPFPLPNPFEREALTILIEECSEVIQRTTKLLRFGRDEKQKKQRLTNRARLSQEIGQLKYMIGFVANLDLIDHKDIQKGYTEKGPKVEQYMQSKLPGSDKPGRKRGGKNKSK